MLRGKLGEVLYSFFFAPCSITEQPVVQMFRTAYDARNDHRHGGIFYWLFLQLTFGHHWVSHMSKFKVIWEASLYWCSSITSQHMTLPASCCTLAPAPGLRQTTVAYWLLIDGTLRTDGQDTVPLHECSLLEASSGKNELKWSVYIDLYIFL